MEMHLVYTDVRSRELKQRGRKGSSGVASRRKEKKPFFRVITPKGKLSFGMCETGKERGKNSVKSPQRLSVFVYIRHTVQRICILKKTKMRKKG